MIATQVLRVAARGASGIFWSTLLALGACTPPPAEERGAQTAPHPSAKAAGADNGVSSDCTAWAMRTHGRYRYENNVWGAKKAKGKFEQCLLSRAVGGATQLGWSWDFPGFDPSVFAYPEVVVGWKPWSGGATTDPHFPLRVADVRALSLDYDVETEVTGSYDLAPEIWLTNQPASAQPNPESITTEVMFWMDYTQGARPAGKRVDEVELNGVRYELWHEESIGVEANGKGWRLLSFKSPKRQLSGRIDIAALLRHLVSRGLASDNDYVASVEFGNEVMGGRGTTWIRHFDVTVAP